ncbi:MAG: peptidase [Erythrobacter sp.]|nr:peptidase [Erythrobacter sp.]
MHLQQLSRTAHGDLRIDPDKARSQAASAHLVPLSRAELRQASRSYPLFFAKDLETGQFFPAALLGLKASENLFWDGAVFDADYIPLNIRRLPFYIGGENPAQGMICIDADSAGIDPKGECRILEDDGSDSAYIQGIQAMLATLSQQHEPTRQFAQTAADLGLLSEIKLDIVLDDGERIEVAGLYGIDDRNFEQNFDRIGTFEEKMLYAAMMLSLDNVAGLVRRKNIRNGALAAWHTPASG